MTIQELMTRHSRVTEAYENLVRDVQNDALAQFYFLQLLRPAWNLFILRNYAPNFERAAKNGYPYMQFAYARYHDCVQPQPDSATIAHEYYKKAANAGIADALMYMAFAYRDGDYGHVDREEYIRLRDMAADNNSVTAHQQILRDWIFGNLNTEKNPREAYDILDKFIHNAQENNRPFDPRYYHLIADACCELGRVLEADAWYNDAIQAGDVTAYYWLILLRAGDDNGNIIDYQEADLLLQTAYDQLTADAYIVFQNYINEDKYANLDHDLQREAHELLNEQLQFAYRLGEPLGATSLGINYRNGYYGFEQNDKQAWLWFTKAATLRESVAYAQMADMIDEGTAPSNATEQDQHFYELQALRLGDSSMLAKVVGAYTRGFLNEYAQEIEKYYIPEFNQSEDPDDRPDDHESDPKFNPYALPDFYDETDDEDFGIEVDDGRYDAYI